MSSRIFLHPNSPLSLFFLSFSFFYRAEGSNTYPRRGIVHIDKNVGRSSGRAILIPRYFSICRPNPLSSVCNPLHSARSNGERITWKRTMAFKWKRTGSGRTRLSRSFFFFFTLSFPPPPLFLIPVLFFRIVFRKERSFFSAFSNNSNHSFRIEELMFLNPSYASIAERQRIESQEKEKYREGKTPCTPCTVFNLGELGQTLLFFYRSSVGRSVEL